MSFWSTVRSVGDAFGLWKRHVVPVGYELGTTIYRESKRSTQIANVGRPTRPLLPGTIQRLQPLFPELDLHEIRVRRRCRLPSNRFREGGPIYAMTFGNTIFWRDDLDENDPRDLTKLIHEIVHADQVRRYGGETEFACAYGVGYLDGGGSLPDYLHNPTAYHRNPLEAQAYSFEAQFRDDEGKVIADRLPGSTRPP
jgi:hypothetical protein